ncbi:MAG: mannosyltransferase [Flavobacteriaceae bacterium]|nr:mannosyltransferase [Flavobacteriaceae bacterium]
MKNIQIHLNKKVTILIILNIVAYILFAYNLQRTEYVKFIALYTALFILFYLFVFKNKEKFQTLVWISFLFRILFLFSIPNLSQDFYRFIWDGRIILEGINPYLYTPESFITQNVFPINQVQELYNGMGNLNGSHFSNYPPIKQLSFLIAGFFSKNSIIGSVIVLRLLLILADFGTLYFGKKLLQKLNIPIKNIFWYLLNPFIIIELVGNLHFEAVLIFFLVWSLYLLHIGKWKWAALILALSISVKLIPLIFLPLFFQKLGIKKSMFFYGIVTVTTLLFFAPFYSSEFLTNYSETIGLYFQKFEFNASIYYIFREIGYSFRGWNEIAIIGKIIPIIVLLFVLFRTFLRDNKTTINLVHAMLFVLSFYYFTATTVHPWYIAPLLILSIFTTYKFPLVWSVVIVLSYFTYINLDYKENVLLLIIEYSIVYGFLIWELFIKKGTSQILSKK